jgi:hypothetical protein
MGGTKVIQECDGEVLVQNLDLRVEAIRRDNPELERGNWTVIFKTCFATKKEINHSGTRELT